ncbi:MAG TPA: tetratricopeptide repeat-containing protein [Thermoanaerobaculia bacterium]|nr:tetratricopeptide repeat-containing protein [Thermoanaerobaculia bacterium]
MADTQGTCFVVMGFGKKTDFETGRVLDLDKSYRNMIKPAVEAAGLQCIRADEIVHSGLIDVPMYEQLLNADVVIADLSTSNKNAFYELGVRHALRPFTTVVISEDGIKTFPFDVNHVAVRQYHHLGEDIGFDEVMRFRQLLTQAIVEITKKSPRPKDSPVYTFLNGLNPPALAAVVQAAVQAVVETGPKPESAPESAPKADDSTHSVLMQQVDDAQKRGDFVTAKSLLGVIRGMMKGKDPNRPENPYIIQRLALITYKSKFPTEEAALKEAHELLASLDPATSNDTETLGLWGSVHKRLWDLTKDRGQLDEAIRGYERGYYLRNDYYNGINLAFLLNCRAAEATDPAEAVADFVQARRVRKEVLTICEQWLAANPVPDASSASPEAVLQAQKNQYWVLATLGEAYLGLGDEVKGQALLETAYAAAPEGWMADSTREQMAKLELLLDKSPLKFVRADAGG